MPSVNRLQLGKIMIVDDEPQNVSSYERLLKFEGFNNIASITDPAKAVDLYKEFKPDIVLLDLDMPYLNGLEVMAQLNKIETESYIPVLVITARQEDKCVIKALEAGARDYVMKPFNNVELLNRIKNILEVRMLHKDVQRQNEALEEKVQERTCELEDTRFEIIRRLGRASEYRDNETGLHIVRISTMCALLAKTALLDEKHQKLILNASPMHDVGKIGVPDSILLKPGKLNSEEWKIMKTHTVIGAELLAGHDSDLMKMAHVIALTHHEKWDGSGYPFGLKGKNIPIEGRICAICDVFDALTSERPYKKAWSIQDSLEEIYKSSGSHFDPYLVEQFRKVKDEITEIKLKHQEPGNNKVANDMSTPPFTAEERQASYNIQL